MNPIEAMYPTDNNKVTVIFAVNTNKTPSEELAYVQEYLPCGIKQVQGCYDATLENAYVANTSNTFHLDEIEQLARLHGQESILFVDTDKIATLYYVETGVYETLGTFKSVSPAEAMDKHDAWTRDGSTFWIVEA